MYGNVLVPLTGWGFSFVCTHTCTRAHTHTRVRANTEPLARTLRCLFPFQSKRTNYASCRFPKATLMV